MVKTLKGVGTSIVDDACSGWPSTVTCLGIKNQIDQCTRDNGRISSDKIASEMSISHMVRCGARMV
jgi:hypothetical protein